MVPRSRRLRSCWSGTHPDDRDLLLEAKRITYRGGRVRELQWRVLLPDGEVRWLRAQMHAEREKGWWLKRVAGWIAESDEAAGRTGRAGAAELEDVEVNEVGVEATAG